MWSALQRSPLWLDSKVKPNRGEAELDVTHPLARGMVACWIDAEPIVEDYGPRGNTAIRAGSAIPRVAQGSGGPALTYDGGSSRLLTIRVKTTDLTSALTIAQGIQPRGSFINHRNSIFRGDGAAGQFGIIIFSDGHWESESGAGVSGGTLTLNRDFNIAYTLTGVAGIVQTYTNGRPISSASPRTAAAKDQDCTIGADVVNGRFFSGLIYYTYLYNRALSASEVSWLHQEPYAMFRPIVRRRLYADIVLERRAVLPVEWQAFVAINRKALIPVDWAGQLGIRRLLIPVEWGGVITRRAQLPAEWSGIDEDLLVHVWNVLQHLDTPIIHVWNVVSLLLDEGFDIQHIWNVLAVLADLQHAWNVIPDVVTPFSQDVQQPSAETEKNP